MADHSINAEQIGVYEIPLQAGVVTTVQIATRYHPIQNRVQVSVHDATAPVYAKLGNTVTAKEPASSVVTAGTWMDMQAGLNGTSSTIALVSTADATVSVYRA
jgi:hypothetical protein